MKNVFFAVCAALAALMILAGCDSAPRYSVRRVTIDGDTARLVGMYFTGALRARGVRISESAENAPVLRATSVIDRKEHGVRVFTFELTDDTGVSIREVVSTQDVPLGEFTACIHRGAEQAADALVRRWDSKRRPAQAPPAQAAPKSDKDPNRHFSTS